MFVNALNASYPNIKTFASYAHDGLTQKPGEYNDWHMYGTPDNFAAAYTKFSNFTGTSTVNPTMIGEFAVVGNNAPTGVNWSALNEHPTWIGSVGEAVFLLGAENNADTIFGASYAPTLKNVNSYQWGPDMIEFQADTSKTVLCTSWHTVKLLSETRFTQSRAVSASLPPGPVYWAAGINEDTGSNIIKFATYNTTSVATVSMAVTFPGVGRGAKANLTILTGSDPMAFSTVGNDVVEATTVQLVAGKDGVFTFGLPDLAVAVLATIPKGYQGTTGLDTKFAGFGGYGGCKSGKARMVGGSGNGC